MGTEIHSTEHLECLSLAPNTRELRKRHVGTLNHHWNWALALGIILHWDPLILCEFRWNCHQQDKCIWRTWPCRTGLTLLMLCIKCWVWKILPEVQMCLSIRDISLVLLMQMQTFLKKKKKVVISFCMRASGTTPSLWASRLLSRLLLSAEHGSVAMLSSAVKPPREMSLCNHFCSHPAALFSDFLTTLWVCARNWVTGKIQRKAEKWQKITYFGHFS